MNQLGPDGQQVVQDVTDFVNGINQRISDDQSSPDQMPAEYGALQIQPTTWTPADVVAIALLIQAEFAGGGGSELQNAVFLKDAQAKLGAKKGNALWRDMAQSNDPTAPMSLTQRRSSRQARLTSWGGSMATNLSWSGLCWQNSWIQLL